MCWDGVFGRCFDTAFGRRVRRLYKENNLLAFGVVGHIMSTMVFCDMVEKLSGGSGTSWSPLRLMGPTIWLPLRTLTGKLMAAQTLVHSVMYFIACYYLVQARYRKNITLMGPWIVMHCFFMVYQIVLVMENRDDYELWEALLAVFHFLLHVMLPLAASHTGIHWIPRAAPPPRRPGVPVSTELDALYALISEEDPESTGHSAETVVVTDERWSMPPPPPYHVAVGTPSHATGDSSSEYRGGGAIVTWPWRWRLFREAAAAAAATATAGIPLQTFEAIIEPEISEAAAAAAVEQLQPSEAVEPQRPGGRAAPRARRTRWVGRFWWRGLLAAAEEPTAGGQQIQLERLSAPRRRAVAGPGPDPASDQPLLH